MTEKLKPCPFCGEEAEFHKFYDGSITASCTKCGIRTVHKFGEYAYAKVAKV